jgi:hypothetical protein
LKPRTKILPIVVVFFIVLALPSVNRGQSITTGTIVVFAQTKTRVIIAADSRAGTVHNGTAVQRIDDSYCKIVPLGRYLVFTATGILGDGNQAGNATSIAITAFSAAPQSEKISIQEGENILARWASSMMKDFRKLSQESLSSYAEASSGILTNGVLVGTERAGHVWISVAQIFYKNGVITAENFNLTSSDPSTTYNAVGKGEIYQEFEVEKTSSRAVAERLAWNKKGLKGVPLDRFKARRLVELTILYHTNKVDVGGPVDEIEIDANGAHWIQVKRNCRCKIPVKNSAKSSN